MTKQNITDEFTKRFGIEMDNVKARLAELKGKGRELKVEARKDFQKTMQALEKREKELEARMGEWVRVGKMAGADVKKGLERAAKELKKGVDDAASHLK